jgi:hypothetical protein
MKNMKIKLFVIFIFLIISFSSFCADIEDGIEDSTIDEYYELDKIQKNINFITLNAISKAYTTINREKIEQYKNRNAVVSGVVIEQGGVIKGDIIIIDRSVGDKTALAR